MSVVERAVDLLEEFIDEETRALESSMTLDKTGRLLYESKKRYLSNIKELLAVKNM